MAARSEAGEPGAPLGPPGAQATYRLEGTTGSRRHLVEHVTLTLGPVEDQEGSARQWLNLEARKFSGQRFAAWILASSYPPRTLGEALTNTARYLFQEGYGPVREYCHRFTGAAVLPTFGAWEHLWPRPDGEDLPPARPVPRVTWLGHPYTLETARTEAAFPRPQSVVRFPLLPDVLVGVPSNQRTRDDTRRFDGSDYPMVRLTREDYAAMIQAGLNCFRVDADQAAWLEDQPVFVWGVGVADLEFPESLYRSSYLGPALFLDEPAVGTRDHIIRPRLAQDPEFRRTLTPRIVLDAFAAHFHETVHQGAPQAWIRSLSTRNDFDLGTMRTPQRNLFSWETMIASAAWQLSAEPDGGPRAIVFEPPGRLGSRRTLPEMNMAYGCQLRPDDPANLADILVGFLRGAARLTGKDWGMSIYGAVDRADAPWLLTRAYDLGATHFFFWDNYQLACVPYGECLALARHLQAHVQNHPHRNLVRLKHAARVAILLPPGYNLGHTHLGRGNLWGLGELNLERTNAFGVPYRQVMGNFFAEIERCRRLELPFDLLWDLEGLKLDAYAETVRVREDGQVEIAAGDRRTVRTGARVPERPPGEPPHLEVELLPASSRLPAAFTARARVREGVAPIDYTIGADRSGVCHNQMVMWELYGPEEADYRTLASQLISDETDQGGAARVEAKFTIDRAGSYRLRTATTDRAGRSAVAWTRFAAGP